MKKIKYILFTLVALFLISIKVDAATITSAKYDGKFKIEGNGTGTIQIVIFDLDRNPIYMTTVTANENSFSITLPEIQGLSEGNYTVKAADYDGSNSVSKEVKVTNINTPNTYDSIVTYIIVLLASVLGIGSVVFINKKQKN